MAKIKLVMTETPIAVARPVPDFPDLMLLFWLKLGDLFSHKEMDFST